MEHVITRRVGRAWSTGSPIATGDTVMPGDPLVFVEVGEAARPASSSSRMRSLDLEHVRADLAEVIERHDIGLDHRRPDAVARRRAHSPADRARERRRSRRRRQLRRVRATGRRRATSAALASGADRAHARRRSGRRRRDRRRAADDRDVVRLHGPRRHAGLVQPREEGPAVRVGRALATAGGVLHRRWGRTAGRHRRHGRVGPRLPGVQPVRAAQRAGAARRHHVGVLLRRQRRAARLLRRDHRDRRLEHRHGRPGDDRGRWSRRVRAEGDRADRRAERQRRHRRARARRSRGRARREAVPLVLPRTRRRVGVRRSARAPSSDPRESLPRLRRAHRRRRALRHRVGARAATARSRRG